VKLATAPIVTLGALLLVACLETPAVQCADGRLCPAGRACDNVHGGCVLPGQLAECAARPDETACSYQGEPDGACFDGVCFPAGCGNGELEEGEVCDDGNSNNGDGCSADCTSDETCGNGIIDFLTEGCDDGNTEDGDGCQSNCIPSTCGDGVVDLEFNEACDKGSDNSNDPDATCRLNCQPQRCSDGIVDPAAGENCDDGNLFPGDGCSGACAVEECGNGVVDLDEVDGSFVPSEECDDSENPLNHDGCVISCRREAPVWTGPPPVFPTPREFHAMAYDAARGKVVLFGGREADREQDGETWEYDSSTQAWTQIPVASPNAPLPRSAHAMAYDAVTRKVVLFGGGETWEYDGQIQTWTLVPVPIPPDAPVGTEGASMAYDAARKKVVFFAGGETWEYDGRTQSWTEVPVVSPEAPARREGHAMAYDAARGKVVLFGGRVPGSGELNNGETWEYDGSTRTWTPVPVASPEAPSPRRRHAMAYDAARGRVVLYGGSLAIDDIGFGPLGETWEYDGATQTWTQVAVASPDDPSFRDEAAMAYDSAGGKVVLFGGTGFGGLEGDTWEYDGTFQTWTQVLIENPNAPSPRIGHAMAYDSARGKVVLFGGLDDDRDDGETWEYDGQTQSWTQVLVASAPSPRRQHAIAYDATRGKVVLFGGLNDDGLDGETWEYDGQTQSWTQVPVASPNAPLPRSSHSMAYDAALGKVVLFGESETWKYDGRTQSWTQIPVASPDAPSPRSGSALGYAAVGGKVVLFGGLRVTGSNDETWTFQHTAGIADACTTGFDGDADGLVGCDDPDCWGLCTPHCPVNSTPLWPSDCDTAQPHCGDGVCNSFLETPRLCPEDCGPPAPVCGDFHCDDSEDAATCPGDCTP
jgi:cysteine-rich repeat protein